MYGRVVLSTDVEEQQRASKEKAFLQKGPDFKYACKIIDL